jgi:hypothetical protein
MRNAALLIGAISAQRSPVLKGKELSGDRPRGIAALALAGLFGLLNSVACGSSSSANEDANHADTSVDMQQVTDAGVVPDASTPVGLDASVDAPVNASVDAPVNASVDAPVNASVDAPVNASVDAPVNASVDAPVNASVDAPVNASVDASVNASMDAPIDAFAGPPIDASACTLGDGGMPGTTCAQGQVCSGGICQSACGVGQMLCADGVCHDLMNENANCGWCGSECSLDKQCIGGECTCLVPGMCPL